jgi:hypothetical protein
MAELRTPDSPATITIAALGKTADVHRRQLRLGDDRMYGRGNREQF